MQILTLTVQEISCVMVSGAHTISILMTRVWPCWLKFKLVALALQPLMTLARGLLDARRRVRLDKFWLSILRFNT
jgi:hypothetical protein